MDVAKNEPSYLIYPTRGCIKPTHLPLLPKYVFNFHGFFCIIEGGASLRGSLNHECAIPKWHTRNSNSAFYAFPYHDKLLNSMMK